MNLSRRELLKGFLATTAVASLPVAKTFSAPPVEEVKKQVAKNFSINIKGIKETITAITDVGNGWHRLEVYGISTPGVDANVNFEKKDEHIILAADSASEMKKGYTPGHGITLSTNDEKHGVNMWNMSLEQTQGKEMCYSVYVKFPEEQTNNLSPVGDEHYMTLAA